MCMGYVFDLYLVFVFNCAAAPISRAGRRQIMSVVFASSGFESGVVQTA
jgi:hypothetical protein